MTLVSGVFYKKKALILVTTIDVRDRYRNLFLLEGGGGGGGGGTLYAEVRNNVTCVLIYCKYTLCTLGFFYFAWWWWGWGGGGGGGGDPRSSPLPLLSQSLDIYNSLFTITESKGVLYHDSSLSQNAWDNGRKKS